MAHLKIPPTSVHLMYWNRPIGGRCRKGEPCTILRQSGKLVQVRFEDGFTAVLDRQGIRASKVGVNPPLHP